MGDSPRCAHDNNHEQQPNLERPVHAGPARDPGDVCCSQSLTRVTLCKAPVRSLQGVGGTATGSLLPIRRDGHDRGPPRRRPVAEFHSITDNRPTAALSCCSLYEIRIRDHAGMVLAILRSKRTKRTARRAPDTTDVRRASTWLRAAVTKAYTRARPGATICRCGER